ncbi:MAG TPA: hypothetical protein ENI29_21030 [bacterium]|nr:hypothetical protein [bacterium]
MLLTTSIQFSTAVPYEYVGVKVGENYSWVLSINQNTLNKFNADMEDRLNRINASLPIVETFFSYGVYPKINFNIEIVSISDEYLGSGYNYGDGFEDYYYYYKEVNVSLTINIPGLGDIFTPGSPLRIKVFANGTDYWIVHSINYALGGILNIPDGFYNFSLFFIPNNLNWSKVVSDFQELFDQFNGNITATEIDNGFIYNTPEGTFNETHKEIEITTAYNEEGVLKNCEITYDSASLLTFILSSGGAESIIGFNPLITILTSTILILSVVFYIKKIRKIH